MRQAIFASILSVTALTAASALAAESKIDAETSLHGLGLLLDTPASPVGDIYSERNFLT